MGTGWIDAVYNNSDKVVMIRSKDDHHNGVLVTENNLSSDAIKLVDNRFHKLQPHTRYSAECFEIPRYMPGKHYKTYHAHFTINFFHSQLGIFDFIMFVNEFNGKVLMRQFVPRDCDFHCIMRIENTGVWIDIIDSNPPTPANYTCQAKNELGQWERIQEPMASGIISPFRAGSLTVNNGSTEKQVDNQQ